jgi:hypothetical protein
MYARRSHLSLLRRVALTAALAALLAPATAAEAKSKPKQPVVTSIKPMKANIGDTITIYGRNFIRGKGRNTVVFKRDGARAVFVKSDVATLRQVRVVLPERLSDFLATKDGKLTFTRFQIRVLSKRFGKAYTKVTGSPMIGPAVPKEEVKPTGPNGEPAKPDSDGDCDGDGVKNSVDADDDDDLLSDAQESGLKLDACKRDTDADGVEDGFEYRSAKDLNDDRGDGFTPYPGKRPYANPLDGADGNMDFDGDGLTLTDEYKLWVSYGTRDLNGLNYSDGKQYSQTISSVAYDKQQAFLAAAAAQGYTQQALLDMDSMDVAGDDDNPFAAGSDTEWTGFPGITDVERYYYDFDKDGLLSDDERDEDADGLPNWTEAHGYMNPKWWLDIYKKENPFTTAYAGTEIQDHDGFTNTREMSRMLVAGELNDGSPAWTVGSLTGPRYIRPVESPDADPLASTPLRAWVQPFNPCLPDPDSRTCPRYHPIESPYPPFDPKQQIYKVFN